MSDLPPPAVSSAQLVRYSSTHGEYVRLNIGGTLFYTTTGTLTKHDSMLKAMFSGRMDVLLDSEGWVLIDRCGKHFAKILNYFRDSSTPLPEAQQDLEELLAEAKYYLIEDLERQIQTRLMMLRDPCPPMTYVPVLTASGQLQKILENSRKPVVRLMYNRSNNKYSYTSNSDENLLKNIELFDRLCVKFASRVMFVKDVVGTSEICCWTFYGHGKKVAEICCESIVYATEKKQTKIEFPETKIYEESLNLMLFEERSRDIDRASAAHNAHGRRLATMSTMPPNSKMALRRFAEDDDAVLY
ncbi:BTB/POZ domain-containing adapter for CUL3-mediated RhoA degradation protein 3-like [Oscarella lobularis]|uniref:BTB/POZ domain-containing adapter for CUL3-mediated RhoA degradation protein 3-like n=1 Tax=Oscarella lobularis TaxID=121494 RepID=UPI003313EDBE